MSNEITLPVQTREERGSTAVGRLRRSGWTPAILTGSDGASTMLQTTSHAFEMLLHHHASETLIMQLDVDGKAKKNVVLKEVQRDPVHGNVTHADFIEISMTEMLKTTITLELVGECAGVNEGGVVEHLLRDIEVECLPGDLVETLDVDISAMQIGDTLTVADLTLGDKVTVLTPLEIAVASVAAPRLADEEEAEEEEAEGDGEPEVIGEQKEDEQAD